MADNILTKDRTGSDIAIAAKEVGATLVPRNLLVDASGADITPLTDAQLRASSVPVSGPVTDAQLRASAIPIVADASDALLAAIQTLLATLAGPVKLEDDASANGDPGMVLLAQRRDSDTTAVSADGDYATLKTDEAGRLKVATQPGSINATTGNITANAQTIVVNVERASNITISMVATSLVGHNVTFEYSNNSTNGTDGNWYVVQVVRSNANTVETTSGVLAATPAYGWEASVNAYKWFRVRATAHTSGTAAYVLLPGSYATEPIPAGQVTGTQPVSGTVTATVTGGTVLPVTPTTTFTNSAASTNATVIKGSAGTLWSVVVSNINAAARYLKFYNKATAPTVGTDTPVLVIAIPAGATVPVSFGANGVRFATGIGLAITAGAADSDTAAVAAGEIKVATTFT